MTNPLDRDVLGMATLLVDSFIERHQQAAIPALLAACVGWAVTHGGTDLIRQSLANADRLADDLAQVLKRTQQ